MNRTLFVLVFSLLASVSTGIAGEAAPRPNAFVSCTVSIRPASLKPGSTGTLLISLTPKKGIRVNLKPQPTVVIDSSDVVVSSARRDLPKAKEYLDTSKPIKHSFTLSRDVREGPAAITGTLTYYYCSDTEGWCSKFTLPIDQKITVVK